MNIHKENLWYMGKCIVMYWSKSELSTLSICKETLKALVFLFLFNHCTMFYQFIHDMNTPNISILFSSRPKWYLKIPFHYFLIINVIIIGMGYHSIRTVYQNIQSWNQTSDHKTKVRG